MPLIVFGLLGGAIADAMDRRKLMLITSTGAAVTSALLAVQALLPGGGNLAVLWVLTACVSGVRRGQPADPQRGHPGAGRAVRGRRGQRAVDDGAAGRRHRRAAAGRRADRRWATCSSPTPSTRSASSSRRCCCAGCRRCRRGAVVGRLRLGAAVRGVGEGFAFLRTQPVLLMTFVVDIIAMTFAWPQAVFPELSQTRFAESANSLGWLFAGVSIGALLMGLSSGWVDPGRPAGRRRARRDRRLGRGDHRVRASPRRCGSPSLCLAVAGAADMVSAVLRTSMLQIAAPGGDARPACRASSSSSSPAGRGWATCAPGRWPPRRR